MKQAKNERTRSSNAVNILMGVPYIVEHAAVARACPQQPQSDLRVFELCQSLQQLGRPGRALLGAGIDKYVIP